MPESYFEDADITIDASGESLKSKKFLRTKPYTGPVTITVSKVNPAKVLETKTVNATKGKFDAPITCKAPAVEKTEESYELQVKAAYKKVNKLLLTATIWPKNAQVLFQDQGKAPQKAFPFLVKQKDQPDQKLATDDAGKCAITLLSRAPYTLAPDGKFKIIDDAQATPGQFRDHKITVETVITAKFLAPDVSQDIYVDDPDNAPFKKQWVNLTSKEPEHDPNSGCDAKGHSVVFAVTADPPENGQPGDKVYFEITHSKDSKRNDPKPALTADWPVHDKKVEDKVTTGWVVLAPMGDTATGYFEVELGIAGGDKCTVKIGGTSAVADDKIELINWRKMYAQVTRTASIASPSLAPAIGCLKKTFIDFEESVADAVIVAANAVPAGSIVDGGAILKTGMPAESLIVGDHNVDSFKSKLKPRFLSEKLPCAHLIFCHEQLDGKNAPYDSATTVKGKKDGQVQDTVDFPGAGAVPGIAIPGTAAHAKALFFSKDLRDNSDAVKSCTWQEVGGAGSGDVTSADYKIDHPAKGNTLLIRLPAAAKALSDAGKDITITYSVAYAKGWYNGWCTAAGRHLVIKVGRPDNDICGTIVHEVGHAISQAAKTGATFPGLTPVPHERFYTDTRGHQGPHCADGIDAAFYNNASNRMDTGHASSLCTCIMFGAGAALRNQTMSFCAKCTPFVKAAPIVTVST